MRVIAALSGGVDSAVAAARAVDAGHEVVGVHLALSRERTATGATKGCCSVADAHDARRVADMLDIPYYVWDLSEDFARDVMDDFLDAYRAGLTPNPCLRCNETIKFAAVLDRALALGFEAVCTGHYARILAGPYGPELHRAVDPAKDQSYVLSVLTPDQIAATVLPLGDSLKSQVRAEAAERGLRVADKPDSHDICFIPDGDTGGWLRDHLGEAPGDIVDVETGDVIGQHSGAYAFTIRRAESRPARPWRSTTALAWWARPRSHDDDGHRACCCHRHWQPPGHRLARVVAHDCGGVARLPSHP